MKFGKLPARADAIALKLSNYIDRPYLLSRVPQGDFGFEKLFPAAGWGMLANDRWGCCVWSGAEHETMLWSAIAGRRVAFDDASTIKNYATTGFDPAKPDTDQGTDMETAAKYRRQVGILDAGGQRHRISAYLAIEPGNITQLKLALWLFKAVGAGFEVPACWMDQFDQNQPWDTSTAPGAMISDGGHYTPVVGWRNGMPQVVSWGRIQPVTVRGFQRCSDEAIAYVSEEMLVAGKSPDGFDADGLIKDLALVTAPKVSPAPPSA